MKTKHTEGDWTFREQSQGQFIIESDDGAIAWCDRHYSATQKQGEANARLLASAPKLLKALQACVERMAVLQEHTNYPLAWPRVQAMEAIAKATQ